MLGLALHLQPVVVFLVAWNLVLWTSDNLHGISERLMRLQMLLMTNYVMHFELAKKSILVLHPL